MEALLWILSSTVMLALLGRLALRALPELLGVQPRLPAWMHRSAPERLRPANWPWQVVFLFSLAILWAGAFGAYLALFRTPVGFLRYYWTRFTEAGDAFYYKLLAEGGYPRAGENVNAIVFYPLYPFLTGLLGRVLGGRTALAGVALSQVCYGLSAVVLAKLAKKECAHPSAALAAYWLYPFGFFAQGVFTEGLFLLLSLSGLYLIRERRWLAAGTVGLLCALSRVQGVLLLLPGVYCAWRSCRESGWRWRYLALAGPALGFGTYLCINKAVCGDFFAYQYYESIAPWYQSAQWLGDTMAQQFTMGVAYPGIANWIYWPQLALYFIGAALLFAGLSRKLDTAYLLYGTAYLGMCYTAGWLISGGRYMLGCVPLYLCVGRLEKPWQRLLVLAPELLAFGQFYFWFMQGQAIM